MDTNYKPYVLGTIWTDSRGNKLPSNLSIKYKHKSGFPVKILISFDILDNKDFYNSESIFILILIAHCLLDNLITELLKLVIKNPTYKNKLEGKDSKMTFYDKINLCHEKDVISYGTLQILKSFNKFRNNIAHQYHNFPSLIKNVSFGLLETELQKMEENDFEGNIHLQNYFDVLIPKNTPLLKEKFILLNFVQLIGIEGLLNIFKYNNEIEFIKKS